MGAKTKPPREFKKCSNCKKEFRYNVFGLSKNKKTPGWLALDLTRRRHYCKQCEINLTKVQYLSRSKEKRIFISIRARARSKNISFNLEISDIILPEYCPVLGIKLDDNFGCSTHKDNSYSVDRILPSLGYTKNNILIISWRANRIKNDATASELVKIADFYKKVEELKNG